MMLWGVALLVVALDQFTKFLVEGAFLPHESVPLIPGVLWLTHVRNPGAAFGALSDMEAVVRIPFFVAVTVAAGLMIYAYQRLLPGGRHATRAALGLIWGGALGNFVDRMRYGHVVDFLDLGWWPVFNVADSCISVGLVVLVVEALRHSEHRGERT